MKVQVISFTDRGAGTAERLRSFRFPEGMEPEYWRFEMYPGSLREWTGQAFETSLAIIYVGALGIAVRAIGPFMQSKQTDPAVLVIDEQGRYVIPVLSGHLGGANELAGEVASHLGAQAVITTATDLRGAFAVDTFASRNRLAMVNGAAAKAISAAVLRHEQIGFFSELPVGGEIPAELSPGEPRQYNIVIADTGRKMSGRWMKPDAGAPEEGGSAAPDGEAPGSGVLVMFPYRAVLGIGCRKGADPGAVRELAERVIADAGIDRREVMAIASIDLKAGEPAIRELAREWERRFLTYTAEELEAVPGSFRESEFVKSVTGTGNVCERAAVLAAARLSGVPGTVPRLLAEKTAGDGVTAALAALPGKEIRF